METAARSADSGFPARVVWTVFLVLIALASWAIRDDVRDSHLHRGAVNASSIPTPRELSPLHSPHEPGKFLDLTEDVEDFDPEFDAHEASIWTSSDTRDNSRGSREPDPYSPLSRFGFAPKQGPPACRCPRPRFPLAGRPALDV